MSNAVIMGAAEQIAEAVRATRGEPRSLLVKVGDMWIDPARVEAIADGEWVEEVATAYVGTSLGWPPPTTSVHRVNVNDPCATLWIDGDSYVTRGVDGDEAARIINRCREATR